MKLMNIVSKSGRFWIGSLAIALLAQGFFSPAAYSADEGTPPSASKSASASTSESAAKTKRKKKKKAKAAAPAADTAEESKEDSSAKTPKTAKPGDGESTLQIAKRINREVRASQFPTLYLITNKKDCEGSYQLFEGNIGGKTREILEIQRKFIEFWIGEDIDEHNLLTGLSYLGNQIHYFDSARVKYEGKPPYDPSIDEHISKLKEYYKTIHGRWKKLFRSKPQTGPTLPSAATAGEVETKASDKTPDNPFSLSLRSEPMPLLSARCLRLAVMGDRDKSKGERNPRFFSDDTNKFYYHTRIAQLDNIYLTLPEFHEILAAQKLFLDYLLENGDHIPWHISLLLPLDSIRYFEAGREDISEKHSPFLDEHLLKLKDLYEKGYDSWNEQELKQAASKPASKAKHKKKKKAKAPALATTPSDHVAMDTSDDFAPSLAEGTASKLDAAEDSGSESESEESKSLEPKKDTENSYRKLSLKDVEERFNRAKEAAGAAEMAAFGQDALQLIKGSQITNVLEETRAAIKSANELQRLSDASKKAIIIGAKATDEMRVVWEKLAEIGTEMRTIQDKLNCNLKILESMAQAISALTVGSVLSPATECNQALGQ